MQPKVSAPRKIFEVLIRDKPYDVYSIEGKEHQGMNDTPNTWWLYWADRLPEEMLPPIDSTDLIPWDSSILRLCWELKFKDRTNHKIKWDEHRFSNGTSCEMWCNGKLVYEFYCGNMDFALAKARYLQTILLENPGYQFLRPEENNGKKIWWKGLPATIRNSSHPGEIGIIPDYTCGLSKEEWWKELARREEKIPKDKDDDMVDLDKEHFAESKQDDYINWGDALNDKHIEWFRD